MKEIEKYIESLCKNIDGSKEEIDELKEEVKVHLFQMISDLKDEGKSEEESIKIAISRFGKEQSIKDEFGYTFSKKKSFGEVLALGVIIIFIIAIGSFNILYTGAVKQATSRGESEHNVIKLIDSSSFNDKKLLNTQVSNELKKYNKTLNYIAIFRLPDNYTPGDDLSTSKSNLEVIYPTNVKVETAINDSKYIGGYFVNDNNQKWFVKVAVVPDDIEYFNLMRIPYNLFGVYIIAHIIWVIRSLRRYKSTNYMFYLSFLVLNIFISVLGSWLLIDNFQDKHFFVTIWIFLGVFFMLSISSYPLLWSVNKYSLKTSA